MHSPTHALFWELWRPHRWMLMGMAAYAAVYVVIFQAPPDNGLVSGCSGVFSVPIILSALYLVAVFSHGFQGDLASARSNYPARLFILPVPTSQLVFVPMFVGTITVAALISIWFRTLAPHIGRHPDDYWWMPMILPAIVMTWIQALLWIPVSVTGGRIMTIMIVIPAMFGVPISLLKLGISQPIVAGVGLAEILGAMLVAFDSVELARRGDSWRGLRDLHLPRFFGRRSGEPARSPLIQRKLPQPFSSAYAAQEWMEWQYPKTFLQYSVLGYFVIAVVVSSIVAVIIIMTDSHDRFAEILVPSLVWGVIVFLGALVLSVPSIGAHLGNSKIGDRSGVMSPFIAALPIRTADLTAIRLKFAAWTMLAVWAIVLVVISLLHVGVIVATPTVDQIGTSWLLSSFITFILIGQLMTIPLFFGLAGWSWRTITWVMVLGLVGFTMFFAILQSYSVWIIIGLLLLKVVLTGRIMLFSVQHRLATPRAMILLFLGWLFLALGFAEMAVWSFSNSRGEVRLLVFLFLPLTRLAAAPLALAGNRHR